MDGYGFEPTFIKEKPLPMPVGRIEFNNLLIVLERIHMSQDIQIINQTVKTFCC